MHNYSRKLGGSVWAYIIHAKYYAASTSDASNEKNDHAT